ncbi:PREDICTED: double C2-like domain-containing protein beta isoform X1 [Cercocebus atys]|uniref:double C2-like domain-containing protein beta isoform X1 n=1 Tax=Cercocebus atys TaxID=9531 RepID=UPI0005F51EEC|nr:PREDICTED: double C2-like domain-containing protein beta isoform X1 [Cercocebus atys]
MNPRRPREKATICIQEHVAIDMCPGSICPSSRFLPTSLTSRGSCPMTPPRVGPRPAPAPAAPPTAPAMTTRMGTISSESKDSVRVPALCSLPPSRQRTSWTSKATSGRLQLHTSLCFSFLVCERG